MQSEPSFQVLGTLILKSTHYPVGTLLPAATIKEDSLHAELFLYVEACIKNPHFNEKLHQNLSQLLNSRTFGERVPIGCISSEPSCEKASWQIAFLPEGWRMPIKLATITELSLAPNHSNGFYQLYIQAVVEVTLKFLGKGQSLRLGRESSLPGLAQIQTISKEHATVTRVGPNKFTVADHQSKNGTFSYTPSSGWKALEKKQTLLGGTLISLGDSPEAFQFRLPSPLPETLLEWKATCVTQLADLRKGTVLSIIPPSKANRPEPRRRFELTREVLWSFLIDPLVSNNKLFLPDQEQQKWLRLANARSALALTELRTHRPNGPGFILPNEAVRKLSLAREGDVITLGSQDFTTQTAEIEPEHLAVLVIDRHNYLLLNKSIQSSVYYRIATNTWQLLQETGRLPAGTDIMLGVPNNCVCFTLPLATTSPSLKTLSATL